MKVVANYWLVCLALANNCCSRLAVTKITVFFASRVKMILSPSASEATEARERGPPAKRISTATPPATIVKVVAIFFLLLAPTNSYRSSLTVTKSLLPFASRVKMIPSPSASEAT